MSPADRQSSSPAARWPPWGTFAITVALLFFAGELVIANRLDGLAGAIIGGVMSYWLPIQRPSGERRSDG